MTRPPSSTPLMFSGRLPVDLSGLRFCCTSWWAPRFADFGKGRIAGTRAENCRSSLPRACCRTAWKRRRDLEIDAAGADRDDAVQKFRAPPRKPRSTASFAPSHATPPPCLRHQYRENGGCRDRPVSSAVIIAPAPGSQALVNGTARQFTLRAVSRSGNASPAQVFLSFNIADKN